MSVKIPMKKDSDREKDIRETIRHFDEEYMDVTRIPEYPDFKTEDIRCLLRIIDRLRKKP